MNAIPVLPIFGVQGWRWDWVREVRELVFVLDADAAGQQQGRPLARQAALRGKQVAGLEPEAYGGHKDASAAWAAGVLGDFTRNDGIFIVRVNRAQAMIAVSNDDLAMGRIPEQQER